MSHLGTRVSALVDGRLSPEDEERCWNHVHACHACRDLVEQEGRVKTQLAQLSWGTSATCAPSHDFKSALAGRCAGTPPAPQVAVTYLPSSTSRRRGLVALGGGAASACVVGVLALGVAGGPRLEPRPPTTDLSRPAGPSSTVTPVVAVDDRAARGSLPTRMPLTERLVALREKMAP